MPARRARPIPLGRSPTKSATSVPSVATTGCTKSGELATKLSTTTCNEAEVALASSSTSVGDSGSACGSGSPRRCRSQCLRRPLLGIAAVGRGRSDGCAAKAVAAAGWRGWPLRLPRLHLLVMQLRAVKGLLIAVPPWEGKGALPRWERCCEPAALHPCRIRRSDISRTSYVTKQLFSSAQRLFSALVRGQ